VPAVLDGLDASWLDIAAEPGTDSIGWLVWHRKPGVDVEPTPGPTDGTSAQAIPGRHTGSRLNAVR
jgi:hypothetical protein